MNPRAASRAALVVLAAAMGAAACGRDQDATPRAAPNPLLRPRQFSETAPPQFSARFETSAGDFVIAVHRAWAPLGADRFYNLVRGGFYDDTRIYRVVDGFMAQWGLNGDPYVNVAWEKAYIVDDPVAHPNERGTVAFAKGGVHTRTTEVFVSLRDNTSLDAQGFAPFGEVVEGMDVVDAVYADYGDGPPRGTGPYQAMVRARGNAYLDEDFPELTKIVRASLVPAGG